MLPFIGGGYDYTLAERIEDYRDDVGDRVRRSHRSEVGSR
jgi:hypothetical protein